MNGLRMYVYMENGYIVNVGNEKGEEECCERHFHLLSKGHAWENRYKQFTNAN